MTRILLTGAGFSRNWGGWLANETFEYLLGCPEVDDPLRTRLWKSKSSGGGFEDTLAELQQEYIRNPDPATKAILGKFHSALAGMFNQMNQSLGTTAFEPQQHMEYQVGSFLRRFDAIFTLNQDLLLELHYLNGNVELGSPRRWNGWQMPGVKLLNPTPPYYDPNLEKVAPRTLDPSGLREEVGRQPYYKLHGSSNWIAESGSPLLVLGGRKALEIGQYPLLKWYHEKFAEYLSRSDARLMVIGYSFGDEHINKVIIESADKGGLGIFIVDPLGVDVLDKLVQRAPIRAPGELMTKLNPRIIGASRRSLITTFGNDRVEYAKVMRFF